MAKENPCEFVRKYIERVEPKGYVGVSRVLGPLALQLKLSHHISLKLNLFIFGDKDLFLLCF